MKIPFTLEEWIKDRKRKVFTEDGKEFVVFNYQFDGFYPVRGHYKGNIDDIHYFNEKDLFIETEPELSEFEKRFLEIVVEIVEEKDNECPHPLEYAAELLDLARKELEKEEPSIIEARSYISGLKQGKAEALKDLPRWIDDGMPKGSGAIDISGLCGLDFIRRNGKLLRISDLEKLPGFND